MGTFGLVTHLVLWAGLGAFGFLLLGALRAMKLWSWRLEQMEAAYSGRLGRAPGRKAVPFSLPLVGGGKVALKDFAGRRVLLVFLQREVDPAQWLVQHLNLLQQQQPDLRVLLIEAGGKEAARKLASDDRVCFPVLWLEQALLARRYHVFAMPFAFLIDEKGFIRARGLTTSRQQLDFVLAAASSEPAAQPPPVPSRLSQFVPRPDDIFVVTYPRSGTTWMQMILYQLTTNGNMDFDHICQVCPWLERALRSGTDLDSLPAPRIFKSHLSHRQIPKGPCKYLYVVRDGKDVAVSYYHFHQTHMRYTGSFEEFYEQFLKGELANGSWLRHVEGWWRRRKDANVLVLHYEDLVHDLEGAVRRIIAFLGLEVSPERFPHVLERCSFAYMKVHEHQLDPLTEMLYEQGFQLNSHLRQGQVGGGKEQLTAEQAARFDLAFGARVRRMNGSRLPGRMPKEGKRVGTRDPFAMLGQRTAPIENVATKQNSSR
jgi:peroxiredoxin